MSNPPNIETHVVKKQQPLRENSFGVVVISCTSALAMLVSSEKCVDFRHLKMLPTLCFLLVESEKDGEMGISHRVQNAKQCDVMVVGVSHVVVLAELICRASALCRRLEVSRSCR